MISKFRGCCKTSKESAKVALTQVDSRLMANINFVFCNSPHFSARDNAFSLCVHGKALEKAVFATAPILFIQWTEFIVLFFHLEFEF